MVALEVEIETLGAPTRAVDAERRMEGGVYYVNRGGLAHYSKWGFKGKLLGAESSAIDARGDGTHGINCARGDGSGAPGDVSHTKATAKAKAGDAAPSPEALLARLRTEEGWVRVPYAYRRAIVQVCSFIYRYTFHANHAHHLTCSLFYCAGR